GFVSFPRGTQDGAHVVDESQSCRQAPGPLDARHKEALAKLLIRAAEPIHISDYVDRRGCNGGGENAPQAGVAQSDQFELSAFLALQIGGCSQNILNTFSGD